MRNSAMRALTASLSAALLAVGCGGGQLGGNGTGGIGGGDNGGGGDGGGTPTPTASSLTLLSSSSELPADADTMAEGITLSAVARDGNNNVVQGVPVTFSASSGELQVTQAATDVSGRATAVLTTAGNTSLRSITVIANASGLQASAIIQVVSPSSTNTPVLRMGTVNGSTFTSGQIAISQTPLSAGGSSGVRVDIVDTANGNTPFTGDATVTFSSACIANNTARIDPNPATVFNGSTSATYVALGCSGDDPITATTTINNQALSAQGTINVLPATLGSIEFVSATPTTIGLRGSGQQETSTVVFRVRNSSGGPVVNQNVSFSLNTSVGGIQLQPAQGTTDNSGLVQTVVRSGTVHTAVRVTATATQNSNTVSSQSEQLLITTGLPDQDSFSVSASTLNVEGLNVDGTTTQITLRAADRFNNPVPDGTAIAFTTEGGSIVGGCQTAGGACTVTWTSQNPRPFAYNGCDGPAGSKGTDASCSILSATGAARPGRSTVLVTALGEESFIDTNGNGRFNDGESFTDLGEAFVDVDADGAYDLTIDEFVDFNSNGTRDGGDGRFNGLLCDGPSLCAAAGMRTLNVRNSLTIVMSGSAPVIANSDISDSNASFNGSSFTAASGQVLIVRFVVRDTNDQPMPAGTTVALSADGDGSIVGTSSFSVPNTVDDTAAGNTYGFAFKADELMAGDPPGSALLELKVTSPRGLTTVFSFTVTVTPPGS